ncbi:copper resistance protein NlpE [Sphingobacterium olei]|uniref:Copper resistance protein NlpE n=2 Tax=Sphingobacterium olei TaxID=2571155 RepID=A0A4U0P2G8_9SPHI|nr:copper resistance protein NlpE [Sphingobacterium olei]
MRIFSTILFSILANFLLFMSCINNKKSSNTLDKKENLEFLSANVVGHYSGKLPCADCEAINTVLELSKDHSYELKYVYVGKSSDKFTKNGNWKVEKNNLVLEGLDYEYKIVDGVLWQLDLAGNTITGDLAENYQLEKIK